MNLNSWDLCNVYVHVLYVHTNTNHNVKYSKANLDTLCASQVLYNYISIGKQSTGTYRDCIISVVKLSRYAFKQLLGRLEQ